MSADAIWQEVNIDTTWSERIIVPKEPVEIDSIKERTYTNIKTNARLLAQWYTMSRIANSSTLNEMTNEEESAYSIYHITNTELFKGKEVEFNKNILSNRVLKRVFPRKNSAHRLFNHFFHD